MRQTWGAQALHVCRARSKFPGVRTAACRGMPGSTTTLVSFFSMSRRRPPGHAMHYDQNPQGPVESQADGDPRDGDPGSEDAYARGAGGAGGDVDRTDEQDAPDASTAANATDPSSDAGAATANALAEQRDRYLR